MEYPDSEDDKKRSKTIAVITTVALHGLLLLCLVFMSLTYDAPPPAEYGIEVDMGGGGGGGGGNDGNRREVFIPAPQFPTDEEDILTQEIDISVPVIVTNKPLVKPQPVTTPTPTNTQTEQPVQRVETPTVNPDALFTRRTQGGGGTGTSTGPGAGTGVGPGTGSGTGGGDGDGTGPGTGSGVVPGRGGGSGGGDFSLGNRQAIYKEYPPKGKNIEGKVVVDFKADKTGKVIYAKAGGRGSTITDQRILEECERAALKSRFAAKADAEIEEKGTIVYFYVIQ